jgi:hypothetical protein
VSVVDSFTCVGSADVIVTTTAHLRRHPNVTYEYAE